MSDKEVDLSQTGANGAGENDKDSQKKDSKHKTGPTTNIIQDPFEKKIRLLPKEEFILEERADPLRKYINDYVMPALTAGLIEISEDMPEDPCDVLGDFFLDWAENPPAIVEETKEQTET